MYTPINNALIHNDFITVVQQRHGSYCYRPNLLPRSRLGPMSVHVICGGLSSTRICPATIIPSPPPYTHVSLI